MNLTIGLAILGVLTLFSAFFSGVEAAFLSLNRLKIRRLVESRKKNAHVVKELKDDSHRLIITLLVGNNLVNIGASALATALALSMFGSLGIGIATGVMTFIVLIVGEILPKSIALHHPEGICLAVARPIRAFKTILFPVVIVLDFITRKLMGSLGKGDVKPLITEEELKTFVEIGEEIGSIEADEREMIHNIFKLNDIEAREIMTPKINMESIDGDLSLRAALDFIISSRHSRIPVYEDNPDRIIRILNIRDTLRFMKDQNLDVRLKNIGNEPLFVPETKEVDELLREMQKTITHIAVLVDEYGAVSGIVTIEDILEEIVGEIYDETDLIEKNIVRTDKKTLKVKGETSIEELNRYIDTGITSTNGYDTISGYILKQAGRIPEQGEELDLPKFRIIIESIENNRIVQVKIVKK